MKRSLFISIAAFAALFCSCVKEDLLPPPEELIQEEIPKTKAGVTLPVADILDVQFKSDGTAVNLASSGLSIQNVSGSGKSVIYDSTLGRYVLHLTNTPGASISNSFFKVPYSSSTTVKNALKSKFSVECVMKVASDVTIPSVEMKPLSWTNGAGGGFYFNKDNGYFRFHLHNGSGYLVADSKKVVQKNKYYHMLVTFDGATITYYLNDNGTTTKYTKAFTGTPTIPSASASQWIGIGGSATAGGTANAAFKGDVAVARMYGKCLSATEVQAIFDNFANGTKMAAATVRTTSSTATVAWTNFASKASALTAKIPASASYSFEEDSKSNYQIGLYTTSDCSGTPVVSWNLGSDLFDKTYPPRFCFSGLNPSTTYYFTVKNTSNGKSLPSPLKLTTAAASYTGAVTTASATEGNVLVYQNFDKLIYGGDISTFAAGYSRSDRSSLTTIKKASGALPQSTDSKYITVAGSTEIGLFNTLSGLVDDFGLDGWCQTSETGAAGSVCARPGYLKVGTAGNQAAIVTPKLTGLGTKGCLVRVSFKACPYGGASIDANEKKIIVRVLKDGSVDATTKLLTGYTNGQSKALTLEGNQGDWKSYSVLVAGAGSNCRIAIGGNAGTKVNNRFLIDDIKVEYLCYNASKFGRITDASGNPVVGAWVNDGFNFSQTNSNGYYGLPYKAGITHISYTIPAEYDIPASDGYPAFWKAVTSGQNQYDFTAGKKIAKQTEWKLVVMADPQVHETANNDYSMCMPRFKNQVVSDLKGYVPSHGKSANASYAYGMVLGDISWNSSATNAKNMKAAMGAGKTGTLWFTVPGNHDWYSSNSAKSPSTTMYTDCYGPVRYSFDRGDVHVIGVNDVRYEGAGVEDYKTGFTDEDFNWIKKDLEHVDKSKAVILCCHIPLKSSNTANHVSDVIDLLSEFANPFIFAGHTHENKHFPPSETTGTGGKVLEYVHAAAMGNLWRLKLCPDGSPAGYTIYTFNGTKLKNSVYKAIGQDDPSKCQIRVFKGNESKTGTNLSPYTYGKSNKVVYANVFAASSEVTAKNDSNKWIVTITANGQTKTMHRITNADFTDSSSAWYELAGHAKPTTNKSTVINETDGYIKNNRVRNAMDWGFLYWAMDAHSNVIDRDGGNWKGQPGNKSYRTVSSHIWVAEFDSAVTTFTVKAQDPFGNVYECKTFTTIGGDLSFVNWGN